jgi:uncharacterized cupredoxin-like copper-binding protein
MTASSTNPIRAPLLALGFALFAATLPSCATSGLERLPSLGVAELGDNVQVARLRLESYYFEPSRLMVQVGVPVRLILENGTLLTGHDFSIFAPAAHLELDAYVPARQQVTVQFVPEQVGELRFYCNIDDHAERGEVGTLVVVDELDGER